MLACTIVARNYLAHARVLARSFLAHNPDASFTVLVLDAEAADRERAGGQFDVVTPYEIGIEIPEVHRMAAIYDVMELATAVKPWLLKTLLASDDTVIYLDPDIEVFAPLDDIPPLAREHGIVLTPHVMEPLDRDGFEPSETTLLRAGMFNLGFIAVGQKAIPFLDWWSERLARECIVAPEQGRFVDQRWVDFVTVLFDHVVLRDPGLNVAWWNLSNRTVRWNDRWEVDGTPIRFFHFSGYSPDSPSHLTKHAGDLPRLRLRDQPDLVRLCNEYGASLMEEGYQRWSKLPYGLATTSIGVKINPTMRARFRTAIKLADEDGAPYPPDPFEADDADAFSWWLGGSQVGDRPLGVNLVGYLRTESGVGEAARQLLRGIAEVGLPYSTITYTNAESRQKHRFEDVGSEGGDYDVNIICVNADQLPIFAKHAGEEMFEGRYTIGVWFWEAPSFPRSMHAAFNLVDEVWVASRYVADAIVTETDKPVLIFPLPVVVTEVDRMSRADVGLPEGFVFLFSFDFLSVFERKNPIAVIEAFKSAFEPGEGPTLVVKSINGDRMPDLLERLRDAAAGRSDIRIVDGYVSAAEKNAMMALCDCYVSLHRSEGFGLTMAEAMAYGRPVIATAHGGNTTFMTEENSFLVPYELVPIPPEARPYPTDGEWAEPDIRKAGELMRRVYSDPETARAVAERGRADIRSEHAPVKAGEFVAARLGQIRTLSGTRRSDGVLELGALARAELAAAEGPGGSDFVGSPGRGAPIGALRRTLRRALWPFLSHQNEVDRALVVALGELRDAYWRQSVRLARIEDRDLNGLEARLRLDEAKLNAVRDELDRLASEQAGPPPGDGSRARQKNGQG